ncbi:hypothetical protein OFC03_28235, partial [Escherichia coli]|nr:hypothetical protein [Escherichia coli]
NRNIGHDVNALWKYYDKAVDDTSLVHRQQMHFSILSIGSFIGRLLSGKKWCDCMLEINTNFTFKVSDQISSSRC